MNWFRIFTAAAAGLAAFLIIAAAYAIVIVFTLDLRFESAGASTLQELFSYILLPVAAALAGALPLRVLDLNWRDAIVVAFIAHLSAYFLAYLVRQLEIASAPDQFISLTMVLGSSFTILLAILWNTAATARLLIAITGVTALLLLALGIPQSTLFVAVLAWVLIPATTVAMQRS